MGYKIERVLNNNAVVTLNENGKEIIITGPGIAFKKKYGGYVDSDKVDKIYQLQNKSDNATFIDMMSKIPSEYVEITDKAVEYCKSKFQITLKESIYISLTDHLYNAVERYQQGIELKNQLLWETKQIYPKEFDVGLYVLKQMNQILNVYLLEDEAAFITFHIINAEKDFIPSGMNDMTKTVRDVLHIIEYHFNKEVDKDSIDYHRLLNHVKFFVNRVINQKHIQFSDNKHLFNTLLTSYPNAKKCLDKIENYFSIQFNYKIEDAEKLYLLIHISKLYY